MLLPVSQALAATVQLQWDLNQESDLAGYRLRVVNTNTATSSVVDVGPINSATLTNLIAGSVYRFTVVAYNLSGLESDPSNEVLYQVPAANTAPVALGGSFTVTEDTPYAITLSGTDPEGSALAYRIVREPAAGTLSGLPPNLIYRPGTNFNGLDSFTFTVSDGALTSAAATVAITVSPVNDPPVAAPASLVVAEDTPLPITLAAGDPDNGLLTYAVLRGPAAGTLSGTPPNLTYRPNTNFNGIDSFTFTASDGSLTSAPATIAITVTPVNDAPAANPATATVADGSTLSILLTASDPDSDTLSYAIVQPPRSGTLTGTAPTVSYRSSPGFSGTDSFTFTVSDGFLTSAPATVSINVTSGNRAPMAASATLTVTEDSTLPITLSGSDPDGASLTYVIVRAPVAGSLTGKAPNLSYRPNTNFNGVDSFTFSVSDGYLNSSVATVAINVTPVNDPPVAAPDSLSVAEDSSLPITLTATDPDSGQLTYAIVRGPAAGTLTGTPPNVIYRPRVDFNGVDSFTFSASDGLLSSETATVTITVTPVNDPPVANPATCSTRDGAVLPIVLTGSDPDSGQLTFTVTQNPRSGTLSGTPPNVSYRSNPGFVGADSFSFTVSDGSLSSVPAVVSISVTATNQAPVATAAALTLAEDSALFLTLAGTDDENSPLTYTVVQGPRSGALSGTPPNLTYRPNTNFNGIDSFTFTVSDGALTSAPATVTLNVTPVNDAPVASPATLTVAEDTVLSLTLAGTDAENSPLTYAVVQGPRSGALSGTAPNLTYLPNANFNGTDSFTFTVSDGALTSAPATVTLSVTPVNDVPVASPATLTVAEDTALSLTLAGTDAENSPLTYAVVQGPRSGALTGTAPNLTYRPNTNFNGTDSFTFTVSDGALTSAPATVTLNVTPVNDAPVASPATLTVAEDTALSLTLAGTDAENSPLTYAVVQGPRSGALSGTAPNLTYLPNTNFNGADSFIFTVSDGALTSAAVTVTITVTPVEDPPIARTDLALVLQAGSATSLRDGSVSVLANDTPADTGNPVVVLRRSPAHGTVDLQADGTFLYRHDGSEAASDSFSYVVRGATTESAEAEVRVGILGVRNLRQTGSDMTIRFPVVSGQPYRLEASPDTPDPAATWQTLSSFTAGSDGDIALSIPNAATLPQRFYRVVSPLPNGDLVTPPWGHWAPIASSRLDLAPQFLGSLVRRAAAATVTDTTLSLQGIDWQIGEVAPRDGLPSHIVQVAASASGAGVGEWWPVAGNDQTWLSLATAGQALSTRFPAGSQLEVIRLPTIADIFGIPGAPDCRLSRDDSVIARADGRAETWTLVCSTNANGTPGYFVTRGGIRTGPYDGTTITLLPAQAFMFQKSGTNTARPLISGRVPTTRFVHYLLPGISYAASAFPVPVRLAASGVSDGSWIGDTDFILRSSQDDFLILTDGQQAASQSTVFFHSGTLHEHGWYTSQGIAAGDRSFAPGLAARFLLVQRTGPILWTEPVPWN